jgi:hypothetical protein
VLRELWTNCFLQISGVFDRLSRKQVFEKIFLNHRIFRRVESGTALRFYPRIFSGYKSLNRFFSWILWISD